MIKGAGTNPYIQPSLTTFAAAATVQTHQAYTNLQLVTEMPGGQDLIDVFATFAALDTCHVTVWGHYLPLQAIPEPQEVTVKGVQFFPTRKKQGPV